MSVIYRAFTGFAALAAAAASSSLDAASFASVGGKVAGGKKDAECCEVCRCGEADGASQGACPQCAGGERCAACLERAATVGMVMGA